MSTAYILQFPSDVDETSELLIERTETIVNREFPEIKGWKRKAVRGGVLCNGSVVFTRETADFSGTIVVFVRLDRVMNDHTGHTTWRLSWDVNAVLAEKLPGDERYYSFDGSFLNGLKTVLDARVALKRLADERRAVSKDFL